MTPLFASESAIQMDNLHSLGHALIFPRLGTERLVLREIVADDAPDLLALFSDPRTTAFSDVGPLVNVDQARDLVRLFDEWLCKGTGFRWAIVNAETSQLIGTVGLFQWNRIAHSASLSFELLPAFWGQGLMSEAVAAAVNYGFYGMALNRVQAMVEPKNERSLRLLARLGFKDEGLLRDIGFWRGEYHDLRCYSVLNREWRSS